MEGWPSIYAMAKIVSTEFERLGWTPSSNMYITFWQTASCAWWPKLFLWQLHMLWIKKTQKPITYIVGDNRVKGSIPLMNRAILKFMDESTFDVYESLWFAFCTYVNSYEMYLNYTVQHWITYTCIYYWLYKVYVKKNPTSHMQSCALL